MRTQKGFGGAAAIVVSYGSVTYGSSVNSIDKKWVLSADNKVLFVYASEDITQPEPEPKPKPVEPGDVDKPVDDGKKAITEPGVVTKSAAEVTAIINENPELAKLVHAGQLTLIAVPVMGTTAGTAATVTMTANTAQAAGLMTSLAAQIATGSTLPPALLGVITPVLAQLRSEASAAVPGTNSARVDISLPVAQRTALTAEGAAGNVFTMTFVIQLITPDTSSVYKGKENLHRTGKAEKSGNAFRIRASNNANDNTAVKFSELGGTVFHVKTNAVAAAEAIANIQSGAGKYNWLFAISSG